MHVVNGPEFWLKDIQVTRTRIEMIVKEKQCSSTGGDDFGQRRRGKKKGLLQWVEDLKRRYCQHLYTCWRPSHSIVGNQIRLEDHIIDKA